MTLTYDHKILTWKYQLDIKFTNLTSLMDRKFFLPFVALLMNFLLGKMFNIFYAYAMNAKKLKMLINMKTRPGVDKVKPKGWIKYSLQLD